MKAILCIGWKPDELSPLLHSCREKGIELTCIENAKNLPSALSQDFDLITINTIDAYREYEKIAPLLGKQCLLTVVFESEDISAAKLAHHKKSNFIWSTAPITCGKLSKHLENAYNLALARKSQDSKILNFQQFIQLFQKTVSHEFNTPINIIKTSLHILETHRNKLSEGDLSEQLRFIEAANQRLESIIKDICLYSELSNKLEETKLGPIDIEKAILAAIEHASARNPDFSQRIHFSPLQDSDLYAMGDSRLFDESLSRVIINALENSEDNVSVSAQIDQQSFKVRVVDHGDGISDSIAESIFEPYTRFGQEDAKQGIGLGLPIARQSLELMQGRIDLENGNGKGACFTLSLPVAQSHEI